MKFICRKEIAQKTQLSVWTVAANEKKWRLDECKQTISPRVIRYKEQPAIDRLREAGVIE